MASPEQSFGERNGGRLRNAGLIVAFGRIFLFPEAVVPALIAAVGGEGLKRVSENKNG